MKKLQLPFGKYKDGKNNFVLQKKQSFVSLFIFSIHTSNNVPNLKYLYKGYQTRSMKLCLSKILKKPSSVQKPNKSDNI